MRFLCDALLSDSTAATTSGYDALARLPPNLRLHHTSAVAAVGAAALLSLREDAELMRTMLSLTDGGDFDEEAAAECAAAAALCSAVDSVVAAMPQPRED